MSSLVPHLVPKIDMHSGDAATITLTDGSEWTAMLDEDGEIDWWYDPNQPGEGCEARTDHDGMPWRVRAQDCFNADPDLLPEDRAAISDMIARLAVSPKEPAK